MHFGFAPVARQPDDILHGLRADGLAARRHGNQRLYGAPGNLDVRRLARNLQFGSPADDRHAQFPLNQLDILIKCAENRNQQFGSLHLYCLFYGLHLAFLEISSETTLSDEGLHRSNTADAASIEKSSYRNFFLLLYKNRDTRSRFL